VAEAVEARSLEDDAVVQRAAVEFHVGEVLEQDVGTARRSSTSTSTEDLLWR
jgi:hypothetical protein